MNTIILNKKDGNRVEAELKLLDLSYLDEIMKLQSDIYEGMDNKEFYSCTTRDEFEETLKETGKIIGCITLEDNKLIAIGVYVQYGYNEHNYGYDINIKGEELLRVGQLESSLVLKDFRGNRLQKIICTYLERIAKDTGIKWLCATVEPNNKYSLNSVKELGYKVMVEKLKYGGLNRYILMKEL